MLSEIAVERRPILKLKAPLTAARLAQFPTPPPKPAQRWRCKPCGTGFEVEASLGDEDAVRCPACNARLGLARDFRSDPPIIERLRARPSTRTQAPQPALSRRA